MGELRPEDAVVKMHNIPRYAKMFKTLPHRQDPPFEGS